MDYLHLERRRVRAACRANYPSATLNRKGMPMIQRPSAVGLILCEQVIIEEKSRNVTVVNSMSRLVCRAFPSLPQRLVVGALLRDGLGQGRMTLIVSRSDTPEDFYERSWSVNFLDPLRDIRLIVRLHDPTFPVPGRHQFSLLADGESIAQSVLLAITQERER